MEIIEVIVLAYEYPGERVSSLLIYDRDFKLRETGFMSLSIFKGHLFLYSKFE